jgi:hypothetical protein
MGAFYVNYTIRGVDQQKVAKAFAGKNAFVSPLRNGCVVASDQISDNQDQKQIAKLAAQLSSNLRCTVLAVLNHDDDILWYQLYVTGRLLDEYDSTPDYFNPSDGTEAPEPKGGDAQQLCAAFDCPDASSVEAVLRKQYVFASDRHRDLLRLLNGSFDAIGFGYRGMAAGYFPDGLSPESVLRIS